MAKKPLKKKVYISKIDNELMVKTIGEVKIRNPYE
jgi:hypothetical protein